MDFKRLLLGMVSVLIAAAAGTLKMSAQNSVWASKADSLAAAGVQVSDSMFVGFNALEYSMQKRYRPKDEILFYGDSINVFGPERRGYVFLGADVTTDWLRGGTFGSCSPVQGAGIAFGHRFGRYHSWRIRASAGQMYRHSDYRKFQSVGLCLEHNYYLVSYLTGLRRMRMFDFYTIGGIGAQMFLGSAAAGRDFNGTGCVMVAPYLKMGFGMQFKFSRRVSFALNGHGMVYPYQYVTQNDGVGNMDSHMFSYGLGLDGGVVVDIGRCFNKKSFEKANYGKINTTDAPLFLAVHFGGQFQNGDAMWNSSNCVNSVREHVSLSVGKWMNPVLGVRLSIFHGRDLWKKYPDSVGEGLQTDMWSRYDGIRTELMVDFFGIGPDSKKARLFTLPLIAGLEGGYMEKIDYSTNVNTPYLGFSFGIQPTLRLNKSVALYLEPHCSFVPYASNDVIDGKIAESSRNYWDAVISLSVGIEFYLGAK